MSPCRSVSECCDYNKQIPVSGLQDAALACTGIFLHFFQKGVKFWFLNRYIYSGCMEKMKYMMILRICTKTYKEETRL